MQTESEITFFPEDDNIMHRVKVFGDGSVLINDEISISSSDFREIALFVLEIQLIPKQ